MIIDIDRLTEDGLKVSKEFEFFSSELVEENAVFLEPVHADITVRRVGDLVYLPEELELVKDQLDEENLSHLFFYSYKIDVKDVVLEQLNLTFPVRPLCAKDCQGICPMCGNIIKEGNCSCAAGDIDPRLEKFKDFIRDKR